MSSCLREQLGLRERTDGVVSPQGEQFRAEFSQFMRQIDDSLGASSAACKQEGREQVDSQRLALCGAYQKAAQEIDPADPDKAGPAIERVMLAAARLKERADELAVKWMTGQEEWRAREPRLAELEDQIRELSSAEHPKAAVLDKAAKFIRSEAAARKFPAALAALDQLESKTDAIYRDRQGPEAVDLSEPAPREVNDLSDELAVAQDFVTLWSETLQDVAAQVESLRSAMHGSQRPRIQTIYDGLATVMSKFPDLDLSRLVDAAGANDRKAYNETLKQTRLEVGQVRKLLAEGPLLSTIDQNPYYKTSVHATVRGALDVIARVLRV